MKEKKLLYTGEVNFYEASFEKDGNVFFYVEAVANVKGEDIRLQPVKFDKRLLKSLLRNGD